MSRFQISEEEYKNIKRREKETQEKQQSKRLRILMLRYEGYKVSEIAKMYGMRINSISQMCRRYREQGLEKFVQYGYLTGVQSLWKLEWECGRNVELFYPPNLLHQDHNMIADFQKDNKKALKKVFLVFVRACRDIKLMDAETLCLDGRTIRVVNSQAKTAPADQRASFRYHQAL